jgi:hypothetical protein
VAMLLRSVVCMLSVLAKLEWLVKAEREECLASSSMNPGRIALIESGVSLPSRVLVEVPLVTRYFKPLNPSPSERGLRNFFNLVDRRGDGGTTGEDGGLSFSVMVRLELGGSEYCILMSGSSRIACTPGGIRKGLLSRPSLPAKACSELADTLSM